MSHATSRPDHVQLRTAILSTIAYFDLFQYPLTAFEIWRWLYRDGTESAERFSLNDVLLALETDEALVGRLTAQEGLYMLKGHEQHIPIRQSRYRVAERKYRKAMRMVRILRHLPFIRMIGVCNNLAFSNTVDTSDIDLFIITVPGRVWTARFVVAGLLKLLGLRPTAETARDRFCVSFFLSSDALNIRHVALDEDPYLAHWVPQVIPLMDAGGYAKRFFEANTWIREHLPNAFPASVGPRRTVPGRSWLRNIAEFKFRLIPERYVRRFQERKLPDRLRTAVNTDARMVVMTDDMIKLYTNDRREQYRNGFEKLRHALTVQSDG
ncbi:MAG: hypothetical protein WC289_00420 [Patescibacteria group bacterium]|jgi:hypothetical protein